MLLSELFPQAICEPMLRVHEENEFDLSFRGEEDTGMS
jgi:hypothetical protein